ncbi:MAG: hypothetical protein ABIQ60_11055, partial [Burkholderiaceae bacterium]
MPVSPALPKPSAATATDVSKRGGWGWASFHRTHLFDYNPAATRFWLGLTLAGALALAASIVQVALMPAAEIAQFAAWMAILAIAAAFPIEIPRSKHSIAIGDLFIFLILALHGVGPAAIAAALEGLVAAMRGSARLSSRIGTPSSGAAGMFISGCVFVLLASWLQGQGASPAVAELAGLVVAALLYFPLHTLAQMKVFALKRNLPLKLHDWFGETSLVGALYVVSAVAAGMLSLNAQMFGRGV